MNPLSPSELDLCAALLRQRRQAVCGQLHQLLAQATPQLESMLIAGAATLDDPAVMRQLQDCDKAQLAIELAELHSVEAASARIDSGDYGRCASCGGAIAQERLRAQPSARMCLACQQACEQRRHSLPAR